jgi:hypothetical protein
MPKKMKINLQNYMMLIGLPASGKPTWSDTYVSKNQEIGFQIASSDSIIGEKGFLEGLDYDASYMKYIEFAIS